MVWLQRHRYGHPQQDKGDRKINLRQFFDKEAFHFLQLHLYRQQFPSKKLSPMQEMSFFVQILSVLPGAVSRAQSEKETLKRDQNRKPAAQKIHFSSFANPSALKKIKDFSFCHLSILSLFLLFFSIVRLKSFLSKPC